MKKCTKCKVEKDYSEFNKDKKSKDKYSHWCKKCTSKRTKIWSKNNKDKIVKWREDNRCSILKYKKEYHIKNKDKEIQYRLDNIEKINEAAKVYHHKNKEKISNRKKEYRINNKKLLSDRLKNRMKNDLMFRVKEHYRGLIQSRLKKNGYTKKSLATEILGCSYKDFIIHLNNNKYGFIYGSNGLDLDHIIPVSSAIIESDLLKLNHYTNFQLLPSYYNQHIKSNLSWNMKHFEEWFS